MSRHLNSPPRAITRIISCTDVVNGGLLGTNDLLISHDYIGIILDRKIASLDVNASSQDEDSTSRDIQSRASYRDSTHHTKTTSVNIRPGETVDSENSFWLMYIVHIHPCFYQIYVAG